MRAALEAVSRARHFGAPVPEIDDPEVVDVFRAWRMMGRRLDWAAIGPLVELLDIEDPIAFIHALVAIQENADAAS